MMNAGFMRVIHSVYDLIKYSSFANLSSRSFIFFIAVVMPGKLTLPDGLSLNKIRISSMNPCSRERATLPAIGLARLLSVGLRTSKAISSADSLPNRSAKLR